MESKPEHSLGKKGKPVYSLGKIVSKYLICNIGGFANARHKIVELFWNASRMFRTLLKQEFLILLDNSEEPDIVELGTFEIRYRDGYNWVPNLFCPAAFDLPLKANYSSLKFYEEYWERLPPVQTLSNGGLFSLEKLPYDLHCLKPSTVELEDIEFESEKRVKIKEPVQPYISKKLVVDNGYYDKKLK